MNKPERGNVLILTIQGDTREDVVEQLRHIAFEYERGHINNGCSGGVSSSAIWDTRVNEITAEQYQADLESYVAELKNRETQVSGT